MTDLIVLDEVQVTAPAPTSQTPSAPYAVRLLTITFQLAAGQTFTGTSSNQLTLKNLRAHASIEAAQLPTPPRATIIVWGMTLSQMNQLTVAGLNWRASNIAKNTVAVQATDAAGTTNTTVFNGQVVTAFPKFARGSPDVPFIVTAVGTQGVNLKPTNPTSFNGPTPASTAMQQIANQAGLKFENNGVNAVLAYPYFQGSAWQQLMSCLKAANASGTMDADTGVFAVWPKGQSRTVSASSIPTISPTTGMIGYPEYFQNAGIRVAALYNPALQPKGVGAKFKVSTVPPGETQEVLPAAAGTFNVTMVKLELSCLLPKGPWEMILEGFPDGATATPGA